VADDQNLPGIGERGRDEISLLEVLVILVRHKRLVFAFPFFCAVAAALISLALHNVYTGTARILPPQSGTSPLATALLSDITGLKGGASSIGQALGLKNPSDLYVGILRSRTIADALIERFRLQELFGVDTLVEARRGLANVSSIKAGDDGIIAISVDDKDSKRAADIANAYVEELDKLTQRIALTSAGRQRLVLERQLRQAKDQLSEAEVALRSTQERTGLISLSEQGKATIESVAFLQARIQAKRVQLAAMEAGMTKNNPEYLLARRELAGLEHEMAKLQRGDLSGSSAVIPSAGKIPETGLEYVRKLRDVQYQQTLFELIAKQYEIAKSQEAAETGVIQILDEAVPPDRKSKPQRLLIVLVTGILAGALGLIGAFLLEARDRANRDPAQARLLEELWRNLPRWRKKSL
jgi:uncharacterized protein involved in exopolysaccharide biosynthesis